MNPDAILSLTAVFALLVFVRPARILTWRAVRNVAGLPLAIVAERVEQRRHRGRLASPAPPREDPMPPLSRAGYTWQVTLYVSHAGRSVRLTSGLVTGPWTTPGEMEAEAMGRWVTTHGYPKLGRLCARAQAVPTRTTVVEGARHA